MKFIEESRKLYGPNVMYAQKVDYYGPADGTTPFVRGTYELQKENEPIKGSKGK